MLVKFAGIPRHVSPHWARHAAITNALEAGAPLSRRPESSAGTPTHATTEHYDRARGNLDRHGIHFLTAYVASAGPAPIPAEKSRRRHA